jgi:DNA-binding IclR family transcriptional regulator
MGVKAIAQALDLVTSTCLHILRVLVDEDLVQVDATKRYSLGVGMLALARSVIESNRFPAAVQPALDRLSLQWSVTAIGVQIGSLEHMVVLALSQSKIPFRLHVDVGSRFPTLISATGRLVAAYSDQPWTEIERRFRALRWQNAPDLDTGAASSRPCAKRLCDRPRQLHQRRHGAGGSDLQRAQRGQVHAGRGRVADQLDSKRCVAIAKDMRAEADRVTALLVSEG